MKENRKILMIAGEGLSSNIMFNFLVEHFQLDQVIIEQSNNPWKLVKRRIKKLGIIKVLGQLLFKFTIVPFLKIESKKRLDRIFKEKNLDRSEIPDEYILRTKSINSDHAIDLMKANDPDIIIVSGCRIISKKVLRTIKVDFINIHAGITPQFRGVHGGYWALQSGIPEEFGVTLHKIDAGIDTGEVISQVKIDTKKQDNFITYPYIQLAAGLEVLKKHLNLNLENSAVKINEASQLWYHPTFWGYLYNRWTRGVR